MASRLWSVCGEFTTSPVSVAHKIRRRPIYVDAVFLLDTGERATDESSGNKYVVPAGIWDSVRTCRCGGTKHYTVRADGGPTYHVDGRGDPIEG